MTVLFRYFGEFIISVIVAAVLISIGSWLIFGTTGNCGANGGATSSTATLGDYVYRLSDSLIPGTATGDVTGCEVG